MTLFATGLGVAICSFVPPMSVNPLRMELLRVARVQPRQPIVRLSSNWRQKSGIDRLRLAGSFVGTPSEYDDHPPPVAENAAELKEDGSSFGSGMEWTRAATLHQDWWAHADRRAQAIKARRSTLKANGKFVPEERIEPSLSVSGQKRREAMRLYRRNEAAWSEQRRRDGEGARRKREPEGKAELQRRRSEQAKRSYATRMTRAAKTAKTASEHKLKGSVPAASRRASPASAGAGDGEEDDPC